MRAAYDGQQRNIGLNYVTCDGPLWYTLADCVASKLLTGRTPAVVRALRFRPAGIQRDLRAIDIAGKPEYRVDPRRDDFYKRLIDLRSAVKEERKKTQAAGDAARTRELEAEQLALKITANATSYGIFVEQNVTKRDRPQDVTCYGPEGKGFPTRVRNVEQPGRYLHPLLATLVTGGARLMLALAERLANDAGIMWAFCDTDSMALAKPDGTADEEFYAHTRQIREWFDQLNPYEATEPLFKLEDANYRITRRKLTDKLMPLHCLAISAKRHALFNLKAQRRPVLRKASAHGLGHLRPPYNEDEAPSDTPNSTIPLRDPSVERWQYDLWYRIVEAALEGRSEQVKLDDLPGFDKPATTRYAATTPRLLRWYQGYNLGKPYRQQVKPFDFLCAFQPRAVPQPGCLIKGSEGPGRRRESKRRRGRRHSAIDLPRPVAPFDSDPTVAAQHAFDRASGDPVAVEQLKTYREAVAQYHMHPEAKFLNGDYADRGVTRRRHIVAAGIEHIGKEANRWEEQIHLGPDAAAHIEYGMAPEDLERTVSRLREACSGHGVRRLARAAGLSLGLISEFRRGRAIPAISSLRKLQAGVRKLEQEELDP